MFKSKKCLAAMLTVFMSYSQVGALSKINLKFPDSLPSKSYLQKLKNKQDCLAHRLSPKTPDKDCNISNCNSKYTNKNSTIHSYSAPNNCPIQNGTYEIILKLDTNKSLDIKNSSNKPKTELQVYNRNNTLAQRFNIVYDGNGYYTIQAKCSGKVLDVPGGQSNHHNTKIWQYDKNNTDAQKWKIIKNRDNTYSFVSKCNGLYLDVTNGNTSGGTHLQCHQHNNTDSQKFFINTQNKFDCINKTIDGFNCGNIGSFITEDDKSKKVLLLEFNPYHHECMPGYTKYFLDLGYQVDIFILSNYENCFSKFERDKNLKIYTFTNYDEIYENSMILSTIIEKYKFVFLNSIEAPQKPLNEIEIYQKPNTLAVAHTILTLQPDIGWYYRDIFQNFIKERRIVTLGNFNLGTYVNPHYFGKIDKHEKNEKTNFIAIGNVHSCNRNYDILIDSVKKLKEKNLDFKVTIVGRLGSLEVPPEIKEYFDQKGRVSYAGLYNEVENSDYILMLIDPNNIHHLRYKNTNASGNIQLAYGFTKPTVISNVFSDFYKLNDNNSITYSSDNLAAAMEKAILINKKDYSKLQDNLKETANNIFNISINNLKNILKR